MRFIGDYHMHTFASDGKPTVSEIVAAAEEKGLRQIAISDHSFTNFICHMTDEHFDEQRRAIDEARQGELDVLQGIEANLKDPDGNIDVPDEVVAKLDVLTVGFHRFLTPKYVFKQFKFLMVNGFGSERARRKLTDLNTRAFIEAMRKYPVDILAHLGHRTPVDFHKVCAYAAEKGTYVELNAKHLDTIEEGIDAALETNVKFIVGSDAHTTDRIADFGEVEKFIQAHNIPLDRVYGIEGNMPTFKDKKEWKGVSDNL